MSSVGRRSRLARDSVGTANAVAAHLPAAAGHSLQAAAATAFTDAMGIALLVAAGMVLAAAVAVTRWLPGRSARAERHAIAGPAAAGARQTA